MRFKFFPGRVSAFVAVVVTVAGLLLGVVFGAPAASADTPIMSGPAPVAQRPPDNVTADALPTVQIDGVVWSQAVLGNTVYAGGSFAYARPAGAAVGASSQVARNNLLAYDITTGNLITSFAPSLNAQVKNVTLSPDKSRLYAVGTFTQADGKTRNRIAAYSTSTGQLISSFAPNVNGTVTSVAVTNSVVYFGGTFNSVNGVARTRLAAVNAADGSLTGWAPTTEQQVSAMTLTPDQSKVVVAGIFQYLNGSPVYGMGAVNAVTGASVPWLANQTVQSWTTPANQGTTNGAGYTNLSADGDTVYATAWNYAGGGNIEGTVAMNPSDGSIKWLEDCHGDSYDAVSMNSTVYTVSHAHYCQTLNGWPVFNPWQERHAVAFSKAATGTLAHNTQGGYADFYGQPSPTLINWFPDFTDGTYTSSKQAAWSIAGNGTYLTIGGEFPIVNQTYQQGLVRFAVPSAAPKKERPRNSGPNFPVTLQSLSGGTVRVTWTANWDRDDKTLTYKVFRDGNTTKPVYTTVADSQWWNTPTMGFVDTGLSPGTSHTYYVQASDADGNVANGSTSSVTVSAGSPMNSYDKQVIADGASSYWPFGESSGSTVYDYAGFNDMDATAGVTRGAVGPIAGSQASSFDGSTGSTATRTAIQAPDTFSVSAWVNTTSNQGGKVIGFGSNQTGNSGSYDRQVYLDNAGHVVFGVYPNAVATLVSSATVNDGKWHQIVASLGSNGMTLLIDGRQVGHRADVTNGQSYTGFWRVGGDNLSGWTNQPSSFYVNGSIGDVAVFPTVLSASTVAGEYTASGRTVTGPQAPADTYGKAVYNDGPDIYWRLDDASGPTAADSSLNQSNGVYSGGETFRSPSPVTGASGTGVTFNGVDGTLASQNQYSNPTVYSEEAWFRTTTTSGGEIVGFGDQQNGNSSNYDRHVYMLDNGQIVFGTYTGTANIAQTTGSYNDGNWHYLVATQGSDGMSLYIDGSSVATNPQTSAQNYAGYWHVGGDTDWGGTSPFFNGSIDEAAFYSSELTATQVAAHYAASPAHSNQAPVASFTSSTNNLLASFDGSGSSDPDGSVASYSWDFGDQSAAGSGVSPSHLYGSAGTYTVVLTVTDNQGATSSVSHAVTVTKANQAPVASFTSSTNNLLASFDGSGSSDPDGSVASYSWDFGDQSAAGSGVSPSHLYGSAGTYTVVLTVTDNQGATSSVSHAVTVTKANQAPVASFTSSTNNLSASFDGSGSSDPDGSVASYSWDFGDQSAAGSGVSPSHLYGSAGTYTVVLTVTDNQGATNSVSHSVVASSSIASDSFARTTSSGWGTADVGGPWTPSSATLFSTANSTGKVKLTTAGTSATALLNSVSQLEVNELVDATVDTKPNGGGTNVGLIARHAGKNDYRLKARLLANGVVHLALSKVVNGAESTLLEVNVSGLTYTTGDVVHVRFLVTGTAGTTTLAGKVWKVGTAEPASAQIKTTDSEPSLQSAGSVGMLFAISSTSTVPATVSVANYLVVKPT